MAADELEEAGEFRIAGGVGDGAVEREVLVDGRAAGGARSFDRIQGIGNAAKLRLRGALGRDAGRLDLDPEAKLHDVEDVGERLHALGLDAERRVLRIGRDEGAHALSRHHQAFGAQRRVPLQRSIRRFERESSLRIGDRANERPAFLVERGDVVAIQDVDIRRQRAEQQRGEVVTQDFDVVVGEAAARERAFLGPPELLALGIELREPFHLGLHRPGSFEQVHPL